MLGLLVWVVNFLALVAAEDPLAEALSAILRRVHSGDNKHGNSPISLHCSDRVACPSAGVNIQQAVFFNGVVHIDEQNNSSEVERVIRHLDEVSNDARTRHLPSWTTYSDKSAYWTAGPRIDLPSTFHERCDWERLPNTHAIFHASSESSDALHVLTEDIFPILANVITHYISVSGTSLKDTPKIRPRYELYLFHPNGPHSHSHLHTEPSLLLGLLPVIFGAAHVHPARALLRGGPHCVRSMTWTTPVRPFASDALGPLRQAIYDVLHHILRANGSEQPRVNAVPISQYVAREVGSRFGHAKVSPHPRSLSPSPPRPPRSLAAQPSHAQLPTAHTAVNVVRPMRVVIVSDGRPKVDAQHRLHPDSERDLMSAFQRLGFVATICCDFRAINYLPQVMHYVQDADICVGVHSAAMAYCAFARPGTILVELQGEGTYGSQSLQMLAQAMKSDYILHVLHGPDPAPSQTPSVHASIVLPAAMVNKIVKSAARQVSLNDKRAQQLRPPKPANSALRGHSAADSEHQEKHGGFRMLVVHTERKHLYVHPAPSAAHTTTPASSTALTFATTGGFADFVLRDLSELTSTAREHNCTFQKMLRNNATYWVVPSDGHIPPYTQETLLGPLRADVRKECEKLVYFELRQLLASATARNDADACDPYAAVRDGRHKRPAAAATKATADSSWKKIRDAIEARNTKKQQLQGGGQGGYFYVIRRR